MKKASAALCALASLALAGCTAERNDCSIVKLYSKEGVLQQTFYAVPPRPDEEDWVHPTPTISREGNGVTFRNERHLIVNVVAGSGSIVAEDIPCRKGVR